jgi:PAS domain S-box-containing protein
MPARKRRSTEERRLRTLLEVAPDAMVVADQAGRIALANTQTEKLFGYQQEEILGRPVEVLIPERFREQHRRHRGKFSAEPRVRPMGTKLQLFGLRKDGTEFPVEISLRPIETAEGIFVTSAIRDITERKRAEDTQLRCAAMVDSSDDAIAGLDMNGTITDWNKGAERLFGYSAREAIGQNILFLSAADARDDAKGVLRKVWQGEVVRHHETVRRRKDGTSVDISLAVSPIVDSQRRIIGSSGIARDITERKRAEQALRASEERLRLAQWAAHVGTFDLNIRTGVNIWTPELEAIYGLPPGGFGGTLTAFENLIHPDDRETLVELNHEAMRTGQPTKGEWRVLWPDGSVHWIAGRGQVLRDESGQPSRMVGVNLDITERKFAEEKLAATNERLHLAIEAGSVGGFDYDLRTGKNVWFGKAHTLLGMSPDETSGSLQEFWDRVHKDDRKHLQRAIQGASETNEGFNEEFRVVWRDGTTHWLRSRGRYCYAANGERQRMVGISVDITERKLAEETLRKSEERFRQAAQAGKMYSFEWDVTTDVVMRSPERVMVLGGTEPLPISHQQFVDTIYPDDRPKFVATIAGLTPESPTAEVIYRVRGSDNVLVWLKSSGRAFFDSEGRMLRVIGMVADITDLKRAEESLAEMTRKLIESQEQERARIGRELHDDINQRLAMLSLELGQLQENPSELRSRVQELQKRTAQISDDVQALSHDLHSSKLEYLGVVAGMKSWCKDFAVRQKMEIEFRSDVSSVPPLAIGLSLFRVLQEALNNAVRHSGVKRIEVQLREESGEIHLVISDLGKGFDVEAATQGRGLGLTSMRERVRLVNGTISIDSKPMGGTTIRVRVPLGSQHAAKQQAV